ncbi:MAG: tetratricopeptide repeat protein [Isosphaeraceae bacterium]|nr:tetratricopeptide repeat protein [Isosphaeraceae bacterium]
MAAVDPYAPCPCGSGQKFKWCCQKVEPFAERAQRLFEGGQVEAALSVVEEGLQKDPGNSWLLTRKALYQLRQHQHEEAKDTLRQVLAKQPQHVGAAMLLTRLELETEGPAAGAAQFQQVLTALPPNGRPATAPLARLVGTFLAEGGFALAALAHLKLASRLSPAEEATTSPAIRTVESSPTVSVWQKYDYPLSPAPSGLSADARQRFGQALQWAEEGLWSSAAAAFESLSADPASNPAADRNAGLCRLWIADNAGAAAALGRAINRMGETEDAVDLEGLRQQIAPPQADDLVEEVQLIWPLRDREALLNALNADPAVHEEETGPIDSEDADANAPEVDQFGLLDRPTISSRPDLRADEIPRFVGHVHVGQDIVALETYDDGRLDALVDRFRALAGTAIAPAHPRTKVVDQVVRGTLVLSWEWLLPEGVDRETITRLNQEQGVKLIQDVWPQTPLPSLHGRTPLQAAAAGNAAVPLRAALCQLESSRESWRDKIDFPAIRARLGIRCEPEIDPETVEISQLHPARLGLVPVDRLNDERLAALYRRAQVLGLIDLLRRAAKLLAERPDAWERVGIPAVTIFSDLAITAAALGRNDEAFEWIRRGRQADAGPQRAANTPHWDLLELRLKARSVPPETWVPELAIALERYEGQPATAQLLLSTLLDLGLVELRPNPDRPDDVLLDTRVLQAVMAEYGPRVTTARGELGIAATRGGLWTPGAGAQGGGGALWTPGSDAPAAPSQSGPSKLIIPGR